MRSTWKETELPETCTWVTLVAGSRTAVGVVSLAGIRCQEEGPPAEGTTSQRAGWSYQLTAGGSQLAWLVDTPVQTTGWSVRGCTSGESAIRYTFQVVTSVSPL